MVLRVSRICARVPLIGGNKLRGQRGDAGKALDKIQRDALGAQNGAGRAGNFQQSFAGLATRCAVSAKLLSILIFGESSRKAASGKIQSGDDERFARPHDGMRRQISRHGGQRRRVAAADVLGERGLDGGADFCGGQFHAVKMTANRNRGKGKIAADGWKKRLKL